MTCCPPQLPQLQPPPSYKNLLLMAWMYWMSSNNSWFLGLLFQEQENRHPFQPNLRPINLLSLCHPIKTRDFLQPKPLKGLTPNSPYIIPNPTTKDLTACTLSHPISFTEQNSSQNYLPTHPAQRRPTDNISSQDESPTAPTGLMNPPPPLPPPPPPVPSCMSS